MVMNLVMNKLCGLFISFDAIKCFVIQSSVLFMPWTTQRDLRSLFLNSTL